ncbi:hypothetical protein JOM56_008478, partial [Amanita muscaria]
MATAYPFTPSASNRNNAEDPLQPAMSLLDSLVTYYEEERQWIERTRTSLAQASRDGIGQRPLPDQQATSESQRRLGNIQQKEHVLEMFEKMIDSRLESCQRVSELLRQAEV